MQTRWQPLLAGLVFLFCALVWLAGAPPGGAGSAAQPPTPTLPDVFAEAVGQANLRSGPGVEYPAVGEIVAGTRYRVLARHARVPWLRLAVGAAPGETWVYQDLVTVVGDLGALPAISDFPPALSPTPPPVIVASPLPTVTAAALPATLTPADAGPTAITLGEANLRYGPDVSYPSIVKVPAGSSFRILEWHALVPWVRVALPGTPTGSGWVFREIVQITGDLSLVPVTSATIYTVPELTPTPQTVVISGAPWNDAPPPPGALAATLGEELHAYLLEQGFTPYTDRLASVFLLDLQTGDTFTLLDGVAYSGMSLTKIPILVTYFQRHSGPLTFDEAFLVADTMMCSENITTNQLLAQIGEGDALRGAQHVTALMQNLGLRGTFIMRPYVLSENEPPINAGTVNTGADQSSARPDLYNQVVPKDLGWLLAAIYQCARSETGLLMERYPNDFNAQECRQMLSAMDANQIGVFIEAGVPAGTPVIHKHGWINDTHGDAGLVIGPNGAYALVTVLYGRDWLEFEQSAPVIAEVSRRAWNALNPAVPVEAITPQTVPAACDPRSDPVIDQLLAPTLPAPGP